MRRTTMPIESELRGVRNAIKALRRGKGPVWLLRSLRKREKTCFDAAKGSIAPLVERKRKATQLITMAPASTTIGPYSPANGQQGIADPTSTVLEENDLFAIRALFDLLVEWEFKEAMNANLNQS